MWWKYPFTRGKTVFVRCFLFQLSVMTNPTIFGHYCVQMHMSLFKILCFTCQWKSRDIVYQRICLLFVVNIRPARTFWDSTHCLLSPFTLDWSRNLWHNPMRNMAVKTIFHISYIHFQRELRKVTSPKWYLSFFVQYMMFSYKIKHLWKDHFSTNVTFEF